MKRRLLYIAVLVFTLAGGIGIWRVFDHTTYPKFRYITSYQGYADSWAFEFQSPANEHSPSDCRGCSGMTEIGNVSFFVDYTSAERTESLFNSRLTGEILEQGDKFDETGIKVGTRVVRIAGDKEETTGAEIVWTESGVFWCINAPTVELAEAFEHSYEFGMARSGLPIPSR